MPHAVGKASAPAAGRYAAAPFRRWSKQLAYQARRHEISSTNISEVALVVQLAEGAYLMSSWGASGAPGATKRRGTSACAQSRTRLSVVRSTPSATGGRRNQRRPSVSSHWPCREENLSVPVRGRVSVLVVAAR